MSWGGEQAEMVSVCVCVSVSIYLAKKWKLKAQEVNAGIRKGNYH